MANNGAFIDKGTLLAQLEWMRDGGTQYDRFRTPAEVDAYNTALQDVTQRIKRMSTHHGKPSFCHTDSCSQTGLPNGTTPGEDVVTRRKGGDIKVNKIKILLTSGHLSTII